MAGPLKNVMLNFSQYSSRYDRYRKKEISNAFNPEFDGGALTDINIYNIHLANGLLENRNILLTIQILALMEWIHLGS